eukprot:TRINITY_DN76244_c0_g1_i1.p1 TRINITY_DN76244_c0_g1~~TRINITY_DN76244_c0_g1_i1.p1  ORF type:complete len:100 (-),score=18.60 TRINITY_DN76244_c0_g1_i1:11-310(-)
MSKNMAASTESEILKYFTPEISTLREQAAAELKDARLRVGTRINRIATTIDEFQSRIHITSGRLKVLREIASEQFLDPDEIGRAVQQECRDRSRMPSSA